jgi:Ca-activated chloride channel family protein
MKRTLLISLIFFIILPAALMADGFIIIEPGFERVEPFTLEVINHHVYVEITDQKAVTRIDQVFYNPTGSRLEGQYMFPVPKGAVIRNFTMDVNGVMTEAELLYADRAREIYEEIVRNMRDPALMEYVDQDLIKVRIFPIEPRSKKRVTITYHQALEVDNGTVAYRYPLNTEKFSAEPLKEVSVTINVKSTTPITNIFSTSHECESFYKSSRHAVLSWEDSNVKPDTDFLAYYNTDTSDLGLSMLTWRERGDDGYFLMNISPGSRESLSRIEEKDITFVLDTSGSMKGEKLEQAIDALTWCVKNLGDGDRFQVIRFSTQSEPLFDGLVPATKGNVAVALEFIEGFRAIGGTYIEEALTQAMETVSSNGRSHYVMFITDGKPTIGETDEDRLVSLISKRRGAVRVFTFGIGSDINTHLLDRITEETSGYRTYIGKGERIDNVIEGFYRKIQSPVLTDVDLDFGKGVRAYSLYPDKIGDIFHGSSVQVLGRYGGSGPVTISLQGRVKEKKETFTWKVDFPKVETGDETIAALWAARRIGFLLDQIRLHGEEKELVDEVTELAREHGIITPYTSYLIIEDEIERTERRDLDERFQTMNNRVTRENDIRGRGFGEYESMKRESGDDSVRASEEFQNLNSAKSYSQTKQGKDRMKLQDKDGSWYSVESLVKNVQGRAVYQAGDFWVDSRIQDNKGAKEKQIRFGSKEYFKLAMDARAADFLALGRNVRFFLDGVLYEIYE